MEELELIETQIADLRAQVFALEEKADEIRAAQKAKIVEEMKKKAALLGITAADLDLPQKPKDRKRRNELKPRKSSGRYYLVEGEKILVRPGRITHAGLEKFKAEGKDLKTILFEANGSPVFKD